MFESAQTDGGDGEEANPLAAHDCAERKAGHGEPDPPGLGEGLVTGLVAESGPSECGEGGEEDKRRVEEDVTRLSDHTILEGDK